MKLTFDDDIDPVKTNRFQNDNSWVWKRWEKLEKRNENTKINNTVDTLDKHTIGNIFEILEGLSKKKLIIKIEKDIYLNLKTSKGINR